MTSRCFTTKDTEIFVPFASVVVKTNVRLPSNRRSAVMVAAKRSRAAGVGSGQAAHLLGDIEDAGKAGHVLHPGLGVEGVQLGGHFVGRAMQVFGRAGR